MLSKSGKHKHHPMLSFHMEYFILTLKYKLIIILKKNPKTVPLLKITHNDGFLGIYSIPVATMHRSLCPASYLN
ncbi:rCG24404 [Rattus norvegicus]|uniref:RCG24404 n=1 Tax=Rattus norvegicus TaxID=10116 RepID=A6K596_RAT|nr:rCG24404 [Rattus norvegicus]